MSLVLRVYVPWDTDGTAAVAAAAGPTPSAHDFEPNEYICTAGSRWHSTGGSSGGSSRNNLLSRGPLNACNFQFLLTHLDLEDLDSMLICHGSHDPKW
jgi:hypothetical protein